jgi:hypothetical protein
MVDIWISELRALKKGFFVQIRRGYSEKKSGTFLG